MDQSHSTKESSHTSLSAVASRHQISGENRDRLAGAVLCAISAAGFASLSILGKLAFDADLNIVTILGLRYTGAAVLLALYLTIFRRRKLIFDVRLVLIPLLLGGVLYAGQSTLYFAALARNSASLTSLLLYVYPAFVALFSWFLYRRVPSVREWAALALASSGVFMTLNPIQILQKGGGAPIDMLGVALVIGSAICYAVYIIGSVRFTHQAGPWVSLVWISLGAGISFMVTGTVTRTLNFELGLNGFVIVLMMIIFSTILALGTFLAGIQRVGPTTASLLSTLEPVFTVLLASFILGESLTSSQGVGGMLVLAAAMLLSTSKIQPTRSG